MTDMIDTSKNRVPLQELKDIAVEMFRKDIHMSDKIAHMQSSNENVSDEIRHYGKTASEASQEYKLVKESLERSVTHQKESMVATHMVVQATHQHACDTLAARRVESIKSLQQASDLQDKITAAQLDYRALRQHAVAKKALFTATTVSIDTSALNISIGSETLTDLRTTFVKVWATDKHLMLRLEELAMRQQSLQENITSHTHTQISLKAKRDKLKVSEEEKYRAFTKSIEAAEKENGHATSCRDKLSAAVTAQQTSDGAYVDTLVKEMEKSRDVLRRETEVLEMSCEDLGVSAVKTYHNALTWSAKATMLDHVDEILRGCVVKLDREIAANRERPSTSSASYENNKTDVASTILATVHHLESHLEVLKQKIRSCEEKCQSRNCLVMDRTVELSHVTSEVITRTSTRCLSVTEISEACLTMDHNIQLMQDDNNLLESTQQDMANRYAQTQCATLRLQEEVTKEARQTAEREVTQASLMSKQKELEPAGIYQKQQSTILKEDTLKINRDLQASERKVSDLELRRKEMEKALKEECIALENAHRVKMEQLLSKIPHA